MIMKYDIKIIRNRKDSMTKQELKTQVGMGFFSCEWIKNNGQVGKVKRAILGQYAWRFTHDPIANRDNFQEHNDYVLAYRVGAGLLPEHSRWVNINPNTITKLNRVAV
jgi:hypothetical protein